MSAVVRTPTPFILANVLESALEAMGAEPVLVTEKVRVENPDNRRVIDGDILTNRSDYYGRQFFRFNGDKWLLYHDSSEMRGTIESREFGTKRYRKVSQFLRELEGYYMQAYDHYQTQLAEQERQRLEVERKARVEATRQSAIEKARAQGYSVKERRNGNKIQLVMVRTL
jgi:hypothetical protein